MSFAISESNQKLNGQNIVPHQRVSGAKVEGAYKRTVLFTWGCATNVLRMSTQIISTKRETPPYVDVRPSVCNSRIFYLMARQKSEMLFPNDSHRAKREQLVKF